MAIAGDTLEIRDGQIYLNGVIGENPTNIQFLHLVTYQGQLNTDRFEEWGILGGPSGDFAQVEQGRILMHLNQEQVELVRGMDPSVVVERVNIADVGQGNPNMVYPYDLQNNPTWTRDNYGPIYIPQNRNQYPTHSCKYQFVSQVYRNL